MYFSKNTLKVLENFAAINQGIIFQAGYELRTTEVKEGMYAEAVVQEEMPFSFAIYDLNELCTAVSLVGEHFLDFDKEFLTIVGDNEEFKFCFSNPSVIISPGDTRTGVGEINFDFIFTQSCLDQIKESSKKEAEKNFILNEDVVEIRGYEKRKNYYEKKPPHFLEISRNEQKCTILTERIAKLMSLDYKVEINLEGISRFTALDKRFNLVYYIVLEKNE